jgi:hypothetical protein
MLMQHATGHACVTVPRQITHTTVRLDAWVSPVSGGQKRPVAKIPLWNLSIRDRTLGDGESSQVTGHGVRLHALGAVATQR